MSAYGAIQKPSTSARLSSTVWLVRPSLSTQSNHPYVTIHHLNLQTVVKYPGLLDYLYEVFAQEVRDGRTYPQEGELSKDAFNGYFFAVDVMLALVGDDSSTHLIVDFDTLIDGEGPLEVDIGVDLARNGRAWSQCVAGYYYVKPNYPGRSSHICNAGFVVPPQQRGHDYGSVLARSYLHYAPRLGYKASVFNLVYVNNTASIRLWERLGFTKAGLISRAGRLRKKDGEGEEYVDAYVFYKSFLDDSQWNEVS